MIFLVLVATKFPYSQSYSNRQRQLAEDDLASLRRFRLVSYLCNDLAEAVLYRSVDLYLYRLRVDTLHLSGSKAIKLLYLKRRLIKRILNPSDRLAERVREIRVQTMDTDPKSSDLATLVRVLLRLTNLKDFW